MSVIVTGKVKIPNSCRLCPMEFGSGECNFVTRTSNNSVADNCPLKSVEGLIDAINKKANSGQ